jgi:hypothetical protein
VRLIDLAAVAGRSGLQVVQVPGWQARGQDMIGVRTVTCHHTATPAAAAGDYPSLRVVRDGRSDLPGPLCNLGLGRAGTVYVVAAGKANHAGVSRAVRFTNSFAIGIEAENPGTGGPWPGVQMDAYAALCAALIAHYGLTVADVRGHKETCAPAGRKTDPDFSMTALRADVAAHVAGRALASSRKEPDMEWTDKIELTAADAKVWGTGPDGKPYKAGDKVTVGAMLRYPTLARITDARVAALEAKLDQLLANQVHPDKS